MEALRTLPHVKLIMPDGQPRFLSDYRGLCSVVIVLAGVGTQSLLHEMAQQPRQFHNADSQVIVIAPEANEIPETPFTVLIDEQARLKASLGPACVVIADRYGEMYTRYAECPSTAAVLDHLDYLELQCPECGHIEWQV
jgi:hypothetical protein